MIRPPIIFDGETTRAALPTRALSLDSPDAVLSDGTLIYNVTVLDK